MASLSFMARRLAVASSSRVGGLSRLQAFAGSRPSARSLSDSSSAAAVAIRASSRSSHNAGSAGSAAGSTGGSHKLYRVGRWMIGVGAATVVAYLLHDEETNTAYAMADSNEFGGMFGGEAHAADVTTDSLKAGAPLSKKYEKNPGKFDELNKNSRETLNADTFDGFKLDAAVNMSTTQTKQFFHGQHLSLGSQQAPEGSYEFSTGYVSLSPTNQNEGTVLNGRMDSGSGRMQGGIRTLADSGFSHNLTFAAGPDGFGNLSHETAYKGSDYTLVLKYASEPYLSMSYLQTVHPQVALGADFGFLVERGLPLVTFAGRFNTADRKEEYSAALSTVNTLNLAFNRKVSDAISVASDLTVAPNGSLVQIGMLYKFRAATARGTMDTTLKTAGTLEVALAPTARLAFSAEANAYKDEYSAGFGMAIEV